MALTLSLSGGSILSKISFCDKQCSNINDNKFKAQILQNLELKHKIQVVSRDYNILNPNILRNVAYHQHILSTYTNGNPYMLYLTKIDNINCAIFIDKKLKDGYTYPKMHCVKYRFADSLFKEDTIFTGELVRDNERRWFFLIDNLLIYKGMSMSDKNILSRFEIIHNIMLNEYKADKYLEICPLNVKKLFLYKDINKLVNEFIPNLSYMCKGIIFYTLNNKHSNYAYIMPRDAQIEIKSSRDIDDIIQEKYPELWNASLSKSNNNNFTNFTNFTNSDENKNNEDKNNEDKNNENKNNENINDKDIKHKDKDLKDIVLDNSSCSLESNTNVNVNNVNNVNNININKIVVVENNNVVFKILKTDIPDIYNLYCIDDKQNQSQTLFKHSIALVPNIKVSHYLYYAFIENPNNLDMKIECKYSTIFEKWTPIRFVDNEPYSKSKIYELEENLKNKK